MTTAMATARRTAKKQQVQIGKTTAQFAHVTLFVQFLAVVALLQHETG